jgi:hypothetical protein
LAWTHNATELGVKFKLHHYLLTGLGPKPVGKVALLATCDAYAFTKAHITGGSTPRPDDVLKELLPMLEVNENLRKHQEDNKARFKHYRDYYGEYIIDRYYAKQKE